MKTVHIYRDKAGFTLIEILIATFILTVGILGVTGMFITAIKANQLGRSVTAANRLAQNLMEQVKTQTFGNAVADMCTNTGIMNCSTTISGTTQTCGAPAPGNTLTRSRTGDFQQATTGLNKITYHVKLQDVQDSPDCGLCTTTVKVAWGDTYGNHTTTVVTYIQKP